MFQESAAAAVDEKVISACIAAGVTIIGSVLTLLGARWQIKSKLQALEQAQMKEVLEARIKAYPKLWSIFQAYVSDWRIEEKTADGAWARRLREELNSCHAAYGVFLSQPVYDSFCEVRDAVQKLVEKYGPDQQVPKESLRDLDEIWSGRGKPGLATQLKDDLGSYRSTLISARNIS